MSLVYVIAFEDDYNVSETSIMVPMGFTSGVIPYSIDIIEDNFVEGDHSFFVRIVGNEFFTTGDIDQTEVVIIDDDSKNVKQLSI